MRHGGVHAPGRPALRRRARLPVPGVVGHAAAAPGAAALAVEERGRAREGGLAGCAEVRVGVGDGAGGWVGGDGAVGCGPAGDEGEERLGAGGGGEAGAVVSVRADGGVEAAL